MAKRTLRDFSLNMGPHNKMTEYTNTNSFVMAVRNILLSRPGNFPYSPSLGMDIEQYMFELADDQTLSNIKAELNRQISKYVDNISGVNIIVELLEDENEDSRGPLRRHILGISVSANVNGEPVTTNFLMYQDHDILNIYNETY